MFDVKMLKEIYDLLGMFAEGLQQTHIYRTVLAPIKNLVNHLPLKLKKKCLFKVNCLILY